MAAFRLNGECATDHLHALTHAQQTQSFVLSGKQDILHLKRFTIVFDFQPNNILNRLNAHLHPIGVCVSGNIAQRGLDNSVDDGALDAGQCFDSGERREPDQDAGVFREEVLSPRAVVPGVPWRQVVGTRHILSHEYDRLLPEKLWHVLRNRLPQTLEALEANISAFPVIPK